MYRLFKKQCIWQQLRVSQRKTAQGGHHEFVLPGKNSLKVSLTQPFPVFQDPWCHRRVFGIVSSGPRKMASILGDGTGPGGSGPSRCLLLLQRSLAIQLTRGPPPQVLNVGQRESPKEHPADEMWMYDKGYNLFQVSRRAAHYRGLSSPYVRKRATFPVPPSSPRHFSM